MGLWGCSPSSPNTPLVAVAVAPSARLVAAVRGPGVMARSPHQTPINRKALQVSQNRKSPPSVAAIVSHWKTRWSSPIGWGEPFCFACKWLIPEEHGQSKVVRHAAERAKELVREMAETESDERFWAISAELKELRAAGLTYTETQVAVPERDPWKIAGRWLDRAHLQDWAVAQNDHVSNFVLLCHLCHASMPAFSNRDEALKWCEYMPPVDPGFQMYTDHAWAGRDYVPRRDTTMNRMAAQFAQVSREIASVFG